MRLGMQGKIVLLYSLLILFAMQLSGVYLVNSLENYYLRNYSDNQVAQAELLSSFLGRYLVEDEQYEGHISTLLAEFGGGMPETETMVLDRHGRLLGGPGQSSLIMLGGRVIHDDILLALAGNKVEAVRIDPDSGKRYYYLALPVKNASSVVGAIFLRGSLEHIYSMLREIKLMLITGWGLVLSIAIVIGFLLARTMTRPIQEVTSRAAAMAGGDFSQLIQVCSEDEIGELGRMFNYLTSRLQETLKEISAEKNKVEAILNYMTDGIVALDRKGKIIHLNPSAQSILQLTSSEAAGLPGEKVLGKLFHAHELAGLLRSSTPTTKEVSLDTPEETTLQVHFAPFKSEDGALQGMLVVLHDVTKDRIFTRMQQEFVANVSHELRTPLTTVKSYVETLLNGAQEHPPVREKFLQVLEKETERMVKLVKDLLVLSQMDYQQTNWAKEEADLGLLVGEVAEQVELEIDSRGLSIEVELPERPQPVYLDRDKIRQVLLNLLDNAIKFTSPEGRIEIRVYERDGLACVAIKDTGIGIPPEDANNVFERFYRVDKTRSRDYGGTGLGLSIARQIVEAHGGSISMLSEQGRGTEVTFYLPRVGV